ncbi:hypothetical protein DFH08DRAFT_993050 [Mycena albidolilacea]|uniref:Uncharacterized protein n=1 Tax=Mycena albidolilacea TaxID=1033008 RepID=A0AAD7A800_9AGAR|nr:hypothetical protein DFH08DRAFT_993050 [Mycena albidolilacea]
MAIPEAVTDKIVHQETRIMGLEARIDQDGRLIAALQMSEARLQHEIDDLEKENTQLLRKLQSVETKPSVQAPPDADNTKKPRNNVFNTAVWKLFLLAMQLGKKGSTLKDAALLKPSTTGGDYIRDTETSNGKLLCPDWNVTFMDNSAYNILQRESKAKKNAKDPTVPKDNGDLPADNKMPDDAAARCAGHRKSRKTRKCDERIMVLQNCGIQLHPHYAFFLQPAYQSTDEPDQLDIINPNTDTEKADEVPPRKVTILQCGGPLS